MGIKTYQAYTMAEALGAAKRDLGADAVILDTRTFRRGGVFGVRRKTIFELTATTADRAELSRSARSAPGRPHAVREYARAAGVAAARPAVSDATRTRRLAQALAEANDRRTRQSRTIATAPNRLTLAAADEGAPRTPAGPSRVARRFILTPAADPTALGQSQPDMQQELSEIRTMVGQVLQRQATTRRGPGAHLSGRLFDMYLELIGQDLSEELTDRIIGAVRAEMADRTLDDEELRAVAARYLAELVPVADPTIPRRSPDRRPLTIALIGPTGVGKTTTLAKLAASFKLRHHREVGLVTCDTYRIAAVDQLRTYAGIIGLPLEVALTPTEMTRAAARLADCDVLLIDTAGRGPNDSARLDDLRRILAAADPHEVHLVLSSTASERVLLREAEAFAEVGADRIVLTKLDEAVSFGVLVNVMQSVGKALSFITTGQEVPDHIEEGRSQRLAELVLGAELHG
ncbi:MAG: flagellar biosynthesis protein FlhF [Planctomycetes bacterium]|nr:flagellar biosynthesis protein FlhF [Planctomycetota bacterium]